MERVGGEEDWKWEEGDMDGGNGRRRLWASERKEGEHQGREGTVEEGSKTQNEWSAGKRV